MNIIKIILISTSLLPIVSVAQTPQGNTTNPSFNKAKKIMQKQIYTNSADMKTIYCGAEFNVNKYITLPAGFTTEVYKKRVKRWEAEHVVPAENFGRSFTEWREGAKVCVDSKGKPFKGRKCAEKANKEYRLMQSDLYNLYPAIGAVNAARQNYNYVMLPKTASKDYRSFGSCNMLIDKKDRDAQPPEHARGVIARTYMYFAAVYPKYKMSSQQRQLMTVWDKQYPVTKWECQRAAKIQKIQGNVNPILAARCKNS
ncbi:endonuclease I [Photobacterium carnosum]|nr:endonuclease I [Photobacterium carnosum]